MPRKATFYSFGQGTTVSQPCSTRTKQAVWSNCCDDEAQNIAIANILIEMDPQYLTSTDPLCLVKRGVLFWLVEQEQINALRKLKVNVRQVVASISYHVPEAISNSATEAEVHSAQTRSNLSKQHVRADVIRQTDAATCLALLLRHGERRILNPTLN